MQPGFLYAIGAAITWGLVYAIDQKVLTGIAPMPLLFIDSAISVIMTLPFVLFGAGSAKEALLSGKQNWLLIMLSVALATLANFLIFSGIKRLDASNASIIEIAYPFFVVLFSYFMFGSTPNAYFLLGGILVFAGCSIIIKFA